MRVDHCGARGAFPRQQIGELAMADVSSTQNTDLAAPSGGPASSVLRYRQAFQQALPIAQKIACLLYTSPSPRD